MYVEKEEKNMKIYLVGQEILRNRDGIFCPNKANLVTYYFWVGPTRRFGVSPFSSSSLYKHNHTLFSKVFFSSLFHLLSSLKNSFFSKWDKRVVDAKEQCRLVPRVSFSDENVWKIVSLLRIFRQRSLTSLQLSTRFLVLVMSIRCCRWKFTPLFVFISHFFVIF